MARGGDEKAKLQLVSIPLVVPPDADPAADPEQDTKKAVLEILSWVMVFVAGIVAAVLMQRFVLEPLRIDGNSMLNTLKHNEFIIVSKINKGWEPQRGEIVNCRYPNRTERYIKRIVGLPGETVEIKGDGTVYIDGVPLVEEYIDYVADKAVAPTVLGPNEYYVMGDNRLHSTDSRAVGVGPIKREDILEKALLVVWPLGEIRLINSGLAEGE